MGLLDDAIREHLELKRRAGADPGEIARTENEALAPVVPDPDPPPDPDPAAEPASPHAEEAHAAEDGVAEHLASAAPGFEEVGEETAELDMQAVLEAEDKHPHGMVSAQEPAGADGQTARPVRAPTSEMSREDSLEWEMPGAEDRAAPPPEIPGQEKLTFE
jgi:hypothetical protein